MTFQDDLASDVKSVFLPGDGSGFDETITYAGTSYTVAVEIEEAIPTDSDDGYTLNQTATVYFATADFSPANGDAITIQGNAWRVDGNPSTDGFGMSRLSAFRLIDVERTQGGHRKSR